MGWLGGVISLGLRSKKSQNFRGALPREKYSIAVCSVDLLLTLDCVIFIRELQQYATLV